MRRGGDPWCPVEHDDAVGEVRGHDEVVLDDERRFLAVHHEPETRDSLRELPVQLPVGLDPQGNNQPINAIRAVVSADLTQFVPTHWPSPAHRPCSSAHPLPQVSWLYLPTPPSSTQSRRAFGRAWHGHSAATDAHQPTPAYFQPTSVAGLTHCRPHPTPTTHTRSRTHNPNTSCPPHSRPLVVALAAMTKNPVLRMETGR